MTELEILRLEDRARDFGRLETVPQFAGGPSIPGRLARLRQSLWREGEIVRSFPTLRPLLLSGVEAVHVARSIGRGMKELRGRRRSPVSRPAAADGRSQRHVAGRHA